MLNLFRKSGSEKLFQAIISNNTEAVKSLIESGVDINARNKHGGLPLKLASGEGHLEIMKLLLDSGADVNGRTDSNDTALIDAAFVGKIYAVHLLIDHNADVNVKNNLGMTALVATITFIAMFTGANGWIPSTGTLELLIKNGADVNIKYLNQSILEITNSEEINEKIRELLIKYGASI